MSRLAVTLCMIVLLRGGLQVLLPNVEHTLVASLAHRGWQDPLTALTQGGASIFMVGLGNYITVELFMAMTTAFNWPSTAPFPFSLLAHFQDWIKEMHQWGKQGHGCIKNVTKLVAVVFTFFQALGSVHQWKVAQAGPKNLNTISMSLILTAGFAVMVYLGDVLEEHGIGDGISFVICMGIVTDIVGLFTRGWRAAATMGPKAAAGMLAFYLVLCVAAVLLNDLEVSLPLVHFKRARAGFSGRRWQPPSASFEEPRPAHKKTLELKLNQSGILPLIMTSWLLDGLCLLGPLGPWLAEVRAMKYGALLSAAFIFPLGYIYGIFSGTALQLAEYLNRVEAGLPGICPGQDTQECLEAEQRRLSVWGSAGLAALATASQFFDRYCYMKLGVAANATSLLLLVGVSTSILQQVTSLAELPRVDMELTRERRLLETLSQPQRQQPAQSLQQSLSPS